MIRNVPYPVAIALLLAVYAPLQAAAPKPLTTKERTFIRAAASLVTKPHGEHRWAEEQNLSKAATAIDLDKDWRDSKDPVVKALASIEEDPELREEYRRRLRKLLEDDKTGKKLLEYVKENYAEEKVQTYRRAIELGEFKKVTFPFPICIFFHNCDG